MAAVSGPEELGPMIADLENDFRQFGSRVRRGDSRTNEFQANKLVDECLKLVRKWRHVNDYPSFRAHPNDDKNLDQFQRLFEQAYDCLMKFEERSPNDELPVECSIPLRNLFTNSFLVEEYPCQTNKLKESKTVGEMDEELKLTVRSLLPSCCKNLQSDVKIQDLEPSNRSYPKLSDKNWTVQTSETGNYERDCMVFTGRLKGVKPIKKNERRLYYLTITIKFNDQFQIALETLPIGFYTHTTQIPILSGNIVWFNAFSRTEDTPPLRQEHPREFPSCAPLSELLPVLNNEFHHSASVTAKSMKSTKRGDSAGTSKQCFDRNNEQCLADMLGVENLRDVVTTEAFLKNKVGRESRFTFWEWFYACFKTRCEYLHEIYERGLVVGFITKEHTELHLKATFSTLAPGSKILLLRFSNNYLDDHHGLISPSIIRVKNEPEHGRPIKAGKYRKDEKKLGSVLLNEIGEDLLNLMVFTMAHECVPFEKAFEDHMEETETFIDYRSLCREPETRSVCSMPSPASSDASTSVFGESGNFAEQKLPPIDNIMFPLSPNGSQLRGYNADDPPISPPFGWSNLEDNNIAAMETEPDNFCAEDFFSHEDMNLVDRTYDPDL